MAAMSLAPFASSQDLDRWLGVNLTACAEHSRMKPFILFLLAGSGLSSSGHFPEGLSARGES